MVQLSRIGGSTETIEKLANLYKEVWKSDDDSIKERFLRHATYEGYQGMMIVTDEDEVVGFSYGYTSLPGQYYHGLLAREFNSQEYETWLKDCFELVEVAVHPSHRRQGLGRLLVTKLLEGVNNRSSILTTQVHNEAARKLYESLGWVVLKEPFFPTEKKIPYVIMGKKLHEFSVD